MTGTPLRVVFMGCARFSVPSLREIIRDAAFQLAGVYTMPDRPKGRGKQTGMNPVKEFAVENRLPVYSQESFRKDPEAVKGLEALKPDFLVVVAYGLILPDSVLKIPTLAPVNLHGSLLPKYRGPSPIHFALMNGEGETGNTIMLMNSRMDEGDMLSQEKLSIGSRETMAELYDRMSEMGASQMVKTLKEFAGKKITPVPQNHQEATYTTKIDSTTARVDWGKPASHVDCLVRAMAPSPGAWFELEGERIKIGSAETAGETQSEPGTIILTDEKKGFLVACGAKTALRLLSLQKPGKGMIPADAFLRGFKGSLEGKKLS